MTEHNNVNPEQPQVPPMTEEEKKQWALFTHNCQLFAAEQGVPPGVMFQAIAFGLPFAVNFQIVQNRITELQFPTEPQIAMPN